MIVKTSGDKELFAADDVIPHGSYIELRGARLLRFAGDTEPGPRAHILFVPVNRYISVELEPGEMP